MAGNAQYWLGETYYARNKYLEAAAPSPKATSAIRKAPRRPTSLLKLGMSLGRANQKQNACVALAQLDHDFPERRRRRSRSAPPREEAPRLLTRSEPAG